MRLAQARQQVEDGRCRVAAQQQRTVGCLAGHDADQSALLLSLMVETQRLFEQTLDRLKTELTSTLIC